MPFPGSIVIFSIITGIATPVQHSHTIHSGTRPPGF
jgi:hypothetical protein